MKCKYHREDLCHFQSILKIDPLYRKPRPRGFITFEHKGKNEDLTLGKFFQARYHLLDRFHMIFKSALNKWCALISFTGNHSAIINDINISMIHRHTLSCLTRSRSKPSRGRRHPKWTKIGACLAIMRSTPFNGFDYRILTILQSRYSYDLLNLFVELPICKPNITYCKLLWTKFFISLGEKFTS